MARISADIGFGYTKGVNENGKKVSMPSVVAPRFATSTGGALGYGQDDYRVEFEGESYYVGDAAMIAGGSRTWEEEAANNQNLSLLVATVAHVLMSDDEPIDLAVGLPMSLFINQRKGIKTALQSLDTEVTIDGETKRVKVKSVFVFPQSAGVYYHALHEIDGSIKNQNLFNKQVAVIDPGYRTVDALYMARGRKGLLPREDLSLSTDLGMNEAHKDIRIKASSRVGGEVDIIEIEKALLWYDGELDYKGKSYNIRDIQESVYKSHANEIIAWVKQIWGSEINNLHAIIIGGGGGEALYAYFKDHLPVLKKVDEPEFANAYGYLAAQALAMQEAAATKE